MFSQKLEMALVTAVREAKTHRHEFVTVEHLLYGILQDELTNRIIKQCGGSLDNLKLLRTLGWPWLTQLKGNRQVSIDRSGNRAICEILIPMHGRLVHLKGYGWVKVFRTVGTNGDAEYWATSQLDMTIKEAAFHALDAWQIEVYHRGLKQFTGVERGQYRLEISQRNHIGLAIRAFVRLEAHRLQSGMSWFEAKTSIIRTAVRLYLANPSHALYSTA